MSTCTAAQAAPRSHWAGAVAAALVMAVGMGFGRFAFTGLYPQMVQEGVLSVHDGTLAASANYAGYLLGALLAARLAPAQARRWAIHSVLMSVLCLAALALLHQPWMVVVVRGVAGVFSALSMIAASLWLLQHRARPEQAALLYAGVGVGIVLSAELLAVGEAYALPSPALWAGLAAAALLLGGLGLIGLDPAPAAPAPASDVHGQRHFALGAWALIALYGLAGYGYIITATYLPLLVKGLLGPLNPIHLWALFGLGAVPACYLWQRLHLRLGTHRALRLNLLVQALGVVLPVLLPNAAGYLGSALLVGATFTGTVTIALPAAKRVAHTFKANLLAAMTAAYGLGQILGPLAASALFNLTGGFSLALASAALALVAGALFTLQPSHVHRSPRP